MWARSGKSTIEEIVEEAVIATNEAKHDACGCCTYEPSGRFRWVWRWEPGTSYDSSCSHDSRCSKCERHWPIQSGADFHEWKGDDKYLHRLYANRNDIYRSGEYACLTIELVVAM